MRVAFNQEVFFLQDYGGITRYFVQLAEALSRLGEDVRIFAPIHRNRYLRKLPRSMVCGWYFDKRPGKHSGSLGRCNRYLGERKIKKWGPDIVHETYYAPTGVTSPGSKTIITVYDMIYEAIPEAAEATLVSKEKKLSAERADHIICISEGTRKALVERFGIDKSKTSVVYLGVDDEIGERNRSMKEKSGDPFLLYVGSRGGYKNFAAVLRAISNSRNLQKDLAIYAFGGGEFSNDEKALINSLGYRTGQVLQISGNDIVLHDLYRRAQAFIYPSLLEGFGLPPLEAMANSCPVVSSNGDVMPEILEDAAEYFDPKNVHDITRAIENVIYSEDVSKELTEKGRQRIKQFTWSRCAKETQLIYKRVVGEND